MAYPYTPAFIAFCGGAPLEEISAEFKIPLDSLRAKIRQEGWRTLANRMSGRLQVEINPNESTLAKIEANRAQNYEAAVKLRDHLRTVIDHLCAGTLRVKKLFHNKGQVIEYAAEPTPGDWVNIATYARTIFDMTYRALGDWASDKGSKTDTATGAPTPAPAFTVILPSAIAGPRMGGGKPDPGTLLLELN